MIRLREVEAWETRRGRLPINISPIFINRDCSHVFEPLEFPIPEEGIRLKTLRQAMGMPMREFAKEFNVAVGSISQWESGEHAIPGPVLKLIEIYEQKLEKRK